MSCNSSISGGNGGSSNSGGGGGWSRKQQKRVKVPKRGPGVAELEKILREEEMKKRAERAGAEGFSMPSAMSNLQNPYDSPPLRSHPLPSPSRPPFLPPSMATASGCRMGMPSLGASSLPAHRPLGPRFDDNTLRNGGATAVDGPGLVLSEQAFPMRRAQCPPPMIWSNSPPSSVPLATGLHNHDAEFPSNQTSYYNYASMVPEAQKMAGMKRPHSMLLDNSLVPSAPLQVPPFYSQSSTYHNPSATLFNSSNETNRDANWGGSLELNCGRFNSENGVLPHPNLPAFGRTSSFLSPPMHLFQEEIPNSNLLPYQVTQEQRSESSEEDHKPFYIFLGEEEPLGIKGTKRTSTQRVSDEIGINGIDLRLKL